MNQVLSHIKTSVSLIPKLHLGTHLFRQVPCRPRYLSSRDSNGVAPTIAFPNGVWERGNGEPPNAASPRRKPLHKKPVILSQPSLSWRRRRTSNYSLMRRGPSGIVRGPCFDWLLMTPFLASSLSAQKAPALPSLKDDKTLKRDFCRDFLPSFVESHLSRSAAGGGIPPASLWG